MNASPLASARSTGSRPGCLTHFTRVALVALATVATGLAADRLESGFSHPPSSARPWVYWFPLDGNISSNGITLDLEAMARAGIGGVLYMETDQGAPRGPAAFGGPLWRDLFKHICAEAHRLGLEVNMNNDAGWCGSGGPWITPELSMQRIVWTETNVSGPKRFEAVLPQPQTVRDYYGDIAVFAFPTPPSNYVIPRLAGKSASVPEAIPLQTAYPALPAQAIVPRERIVDLTGQCDSSGRLAWDAPAGNWTLLRLGHTTTGKDNHPAPMAGRGLECDKLSKEAAEAAFAGLMQKVIQDSLPLVGQAKTLVSTHIDSWEVGSQNWTPKFRQEFQRLRGYDLFPFLPVMAGHVVESLEVSERFLWDVRMTVNDLLVENYAGHFREMARRNGIRLSIEAYDGDPADDMTYGGQADEPMAEFWSWTKFMAAYSCTEMSSVAHVYGRRILGAEAFTATDAEKWQGHPAYIKDLGDWAFCEGINRFVFHRYALQPWTDARPGMSMGPWGLHYERTQTWWEQSRPWHDYLARCQFLLQQGLFVADLCFLEPEASPQRFKSPVKSGYDRPGYNFDGCPPEVVLRRMSVRNGRLVLPDGMSYRWLVLPQAGAMTPRLLGKIKELVAAGATVVGAPPVKSPSLSGYPKCDHEVKALAAELWGAGEAPEQITERPFGKGKVLWGGEFRPKSLSAEAPGTQLGSAQWIWRKEGNPASAAPVGKRYFRRVLSLDEGGHVAAASLVMTADNSFECWVNGRPAGTGDDFNHTYQMNIASLLKPGTNVIAVEAANGGAAPNPAGLIARLRIQYGAGHVVETPTDARWEAAETVAANWRTEPGAANAWAAAMELGPLGMAPWGDLTAAGEGPDPIPDAGILCRMLEERGVPPDFSYRARNAPDGLRYTHRTIEGAEVYFVANKNLQPEEALCSFRVSGRRPEFWWPYSGRIERAVVYDEAGGITRVPIHLDAYGSVFVVFRKGARAEPDRLVAVTRNGQALLDTAPIPGAQAGKAAAPQAAETIRLRRGRNGAIEALVSAPGAYALKSASGRTRSFRVATLPSPIELGGPWELRFAPNWGAPERVTLDHLISWSEHSEPGVKYFSGTAAYLKKFDIPAGLLGGGRRLCLDLGKVAVIAEVKLNGQDLGILWKPPFWTDITDAARPGENALEIKVVNLWINRQIGDEQLPEDSDRNANGTLKSWPEWLTQGKPSPAGRFTFTSWRLWKKNDPLVESGLLGPVTIQPAQTATVRF
ncbi:MAG: glycosyl hydrolase [Limisphaerales bacterium]